MELLIFGLRLLRDLLKSVVINSRLVVYVKLVLLWVAVMGGDFLLEFRLEYLYPIYLLIHNAYEAYKFQGVVSGTPTN